MDTQHQAGLEGLQYATDKGLPVVVMEPLRGGGLTDKLPDGVSKAFAEHPVSRSPAEWSFRWLLDKPEIPLILSGVSTMEQLEENIRIFSEIKPGCMNQDDLDLIDRVVVEFDKVKKVDCTHCGYCLPCPSGVDIPEVFQFYNDSGSETYRTHVKMIYQMLANEDNRRADRCTECGECEPLCPQSIPIIEKLKEAHAVLTAK
jgi:predicted aldo/keto reductase-like oxidoreductase